MPTYAPYSADCCFRFQHTHEKRGASSVPGPRSKGSRIALLVEPSNAESPTPMYVNIHINIKCIQILHPKGRSRCFGFD